MEVLVIGTADDGAVFERLVQLTQQKNLPLALSFHTLPKLSDKFITSFANQVADRPIIAIVKQTPMLIKIDDGGVIKSHLNWQSLTKRIVSAGRKSELILQACKLTAGMTALDGTAGFGHDGLILASTGASVSILEQNPLVALLLFYEYNTMRQNPNWQKLLDRISIHYGSFFEMSVLANLPKVDLLYLDPMFPADSYSAKVNKNMQLLHELAASPDELDEQNFLVMGKAKLNDGGKIVVKRPNSAPFLAKKTPVQSVANEAIRFDRYDLNALDDA